MNNIRLHHPFSDNMTAVSNYFIDYYMPQASGEYVKLYLCLLRQVAEHDSISLEAVAELFDYTERDVRRGLRYWADQGLLDLAFDSDGNISDLVFLEVQNHRPCARLPLPSHNSLNLHPDMPSPKTVCQP